MSFFKKKEKRFVGVDIGSSAIKIVEFENVKGKAKLITYGYYEQKNEVLNTNSAGAKENIIEGLKHIVKTTRVSCVTTIAALPSYTVFTSIIHLPQMSKRDLAAAVKWEAKKFVPMPIAEMVLDWKVLNVKDNFAFSAHAGSSGNPQQPSDALTAAVPFNHDNTITTPQKKFLKILITAAPKNLVSRYLDIFKEAKLNLVSLETESFALERSLVGNDPSAIMVIDIGATATTICVVVSGVPLINRSIDVGGSTITNAIANSLNIDEDRAEQFKRDFGLSQSTAAGGGQIPKRIEFMVSSIITEIKYVLNLYQNQGSETIEKIILAGGSAWLPNITQYLSQTLGVKVFIGDPWARVMYPVELKPVLQQLGPRFAVAVGLGIREIH